MNGDLYEAISRSQMLRDLADSFLKTTGLSLRLLSPSPQPLSRIVQMLENPFCGIVARTRLGRAQCQDTLAKLQACDNSQCGPCEVRCFARLIERAVPVLVGQEHVATLLIGPVFKRKPSRRDFDRIARALGLSEHNGERQRAEQAYFQIPVVSHEKCEAAGQLLALFARQLGEVVSRWLTARVGSDDPKCVTCAKQFAQAHLADDIHTRHAAEHAHLSLQHFCRTFRASAGMTFTEYVCRCRVEKAKQLLADPRPRVTEVALACGFRSIPYFDRAFRRYAGQSPKQYRASRCRDRVALPQTANREP